jgi:hypothetical protein
MSMVPHTLSSVAPSGSSTSGVRTVMLGSFSPRLRAAQDGRAGRQGRVPAAGRRWLRALVLGAGLQLGAELAQAGGRGGINIIVIVIIVARRHPQQPHLKRASASGPMSLGSVGEELNASPSTTSIAGSRSTTARTYGGAPWGVCSVHRPRQRVELWGCLSQVAVAAAAPAGSTAPDGRVWRAQGCSMVPQVRRGPLPRTATDLAVPRSPMMSTPPMLGSTTLSSSASFISSWPAILVKGKAGFFAALAAVTVAARTTRLLPRPCRLLKVGRRWPAPL